VLLCWLGYELNPFAPVIDLQKYWHAVKPILFGSVDWAVLYSQAAGWLFAGLLLEALGGLRAARWATVLLFPFILFARVLIDGVLLSRGEVMGGSVGVALYVLLPPVRWREHVVGAALVGVVVVQIFRAP